MSNTSNPDFEDAVSSIAGPSQQSPDDDAEISVEPNRVFSPICSIVAAYPGNPHMSLERLLRTRTCVHSQVPEPSLSEDELNLDDSIRSFSFQVKPAQVLIDAIIVLCDGGLNEVGLAYIHVDKKGFEINVDSKNNVTGLLLLSASKLMNFQCRRPTTEAQIVNLNDLYQRLLLVSDDDTITVYHVDGSHKFSFIFDKSFPIRGMSVDFHTLSDNIGKHPRINYYDEATVTSVELRRFIQRRSHADPARPPIVTVQIENNKAVFYYIDESSLDLSFDLFKSHVELENKELGKTYCTWFHWNFGEALKKASYLSTEVQVCLSWLPTRDIVFRFNLAKFGDLLIVKRTLKTYPNVDDVERARLRWRQHQETAMMTFSHYIL